MCCVQVGFGHQSKSWNASPIPGRVSNVLIESFGDFGRIIDVLIGCVFCYFEFDFGSVCSLVGDAVESNERFTSEQHRFNE